MTIRDFVDVCFVPFVEFTPVLDNGVHLNTMCFYRYELNEFLAQHKSLASREVLSISVPYLNCVEVCYKFINENWEG